MFLSPVRGSVDLDWSEGLETDDSFFDSMAKTSEAAHAAFPSNKPEFQVPDVFYEFDPQRHVKNIRPLKQKADVSWDSLPAKL